MRRKVKRYSGEDNESQVKDEPFESGFTPTEDLNPKSTKQSFGDAFKAARSAGDSTFTYNGKSYTTKLASESKPASKAEAPKSETKEKEEPKVNGKTFSETIKNKSSAPVSKKEDKMTPAEIAKIQREAIAGPDKNLPAPEPKSAGKKFREFFGSKYKSGGSVRTSASKRGDGIATKGHTRGKVC